MGSLADVGQLSRYVSVDLRADGFRERLDTDADLQMKRIGVSSRILVASPTLLAKEGEPTTPAELGKLPILHQEQQGGNIWHLTADNGDTCTVAVEPRLATGSFDILIAAACQGAGIMLLPAANCREALAAGALVRVLPQWSGIDGILHLVFASRRGMLPAVQAVIDFAAGALRSSVAP
jgi:DNA-binding transcriptional LysR family regulator